MPTKEVGNQKQPFFKKFLADAKLLMTNAKRKAPEQPVAVKRVRESRRSQVLKGRENPLRA